MEALTAREAELGEKRVVVEQGERSPPFPKTGVIRTADDEKVKDDLFTREEALKQVCLAMQRVLRP